MSLECSFFLAAAVDYPLYLRKIIMMFIFRMIASELTTIGWNLYKKSSMKVKKAQRGGLCFWSWIMSMLLPNLRHTQNDV